ncbi:MAG: hypothetical protein HKN91_09865 [Acidimicrobiia bacterium]|nr:hypothetical protein [Acidimicrobiia bacterium]
MIRSAGSPWEIRFDWTLTALMLGAYGLAIFLSGLNDEERSTALLAALVTGAFIVVLQALPRSFRERQLPGEVLAVTGVVATLSAVWLTEAANGGYVLLVTVPIYFAATFLGFRIGMETALLATFGYVAVVILVGAGWQDRLVTVALYLLMGFTFTQARRLLLLERERGEALRAASQVTSERIRRLESAHYLLVDLAEVASTNDLSAVSVAETALLDLAASIPIQAGTVVDANTDERIATWGKVGDPAEALRYPIRSSDRMLGSLLVWPSDGSDLDDHDGVIDATLASAALAFDNIQLLQTVARRSVQDERSRVARELHDDIGPALASLGLGLDILVQGHADPHVRPQLSLLRQSVTDLVERVRSAVAMLRREDTTTVTEHVHRLAAAIGGGPPRLVLDLEERAAIDGTTATEVGAILTEAIRNAVEHALASTIRIAGYVDASGGKISVVDDGRGFDTDAEYPGHFGLVGMRERAEVIKGTVTITSGPGQGTTLTVQWGT